MSDDDSTARTRPLHEIVNGNRRRPIVELLGILGVTCALLLYAFRLVRISYAYNDWAWIAQGVAGNLHNETLRVTTQFMWSVSYRLFGDDATVPALLSAAGNLLGIPAIAWLVRKLGFSARVALLTGCLAVLSPFNQQVCHFLSQGEAALGRTLTVVAVAVSFGTPFVAGTERSKHASISPSAFAWLAFAFMTHETSATVVPLVLVLRWMRGGRASLEHWWQSLWARGLVAWWVILCAGRVLIHLQARQSTHPTSASAVIHNILRFGGATLGYWVPLLAGAALMFFVLSRISRISCNGAEGSPAEFIKLIGSSALVAICCYLPYLPMAGYWTDYFMTLAAVPLAFPVAVAFLRVVDGVGWQGLAGQTTVGIVLFGLSVGSVVPMQDGAATRALVSQVKVATAASLQRAGSDAPRRLWLVGKNRVVERAAAIIDVEGASESTMLRVLFPGHLFVVQMVPPDSLATLTRQRGDVTIVLDATDDSSEPLIQRVDIEENSSSAPVQR